MNQSFYRYPWGESSSRFIGPILPFLGGLLIGGIASRPCSGPYCYPPVVYPPRPMPIYPPYGPYPPYGSYPPMPMTPPPPNYGPYPPNPGMYQGTNEFSQTSYSTSTSFPPY